MVKRFAHRVAWGIINLGLLLPFTIAAAYNQSTSEGAGSTISNPLQYRTIQDLINALIKILLQLGIPIAVVFIIYSGFLFVTAGGDTSKLKAAKETFFYTIVGASILIGAFVISSIIKNTINQITK